MNYKVSFTKEAQKQIKKMDHYTQTIIMNWIGKNLVDCENPYLHGKPLKGNYAGQWRYRVGDYRIIAEIYNDELVILVINVGHRREVYK